MALLSKTFLNKLSHQEPQLCAMAVKLHIAAECCLGA